MESSPLPPDQIARRALRGGIYVTIAQYAAFGIGIIKGAILARLVAPEIFGVVVLATTWVSFLSLLRMEMKDVTISYPTDHPARFATLYGLEIVTTIPGVFLAGLLYLVAPGVCSTLCWYAIAALMGVRLVVAFTSLPLYILQRDIRQGILSFLSLLGAILALMVTVALAYLGHPLLALLADAAIPVIVSGLGSLIVVRRQLKWGWDVQVARDVIAFGFTLWTNGLLGLVTFMFDSWLVGTLQGDEALGYYSKAYTLAKMPMDFFASAIGALALGLYSQSLAAGREVLARAYTLTTWLLARVVALSSIMMLGATEEIVRILLGVNWPSVVPLVRLLALYMIGRPLWQNNYQLLMPLRREKLARRVTAVMAVLLLVLAPVAVLKWGAAGVAVAVSLMMLVGTVLSQWYASRELQVSLASLYLLPAVLCVAMPPVLYWLGLTLGGGTIALFAVKGVVSTVVFAGLVFLFERQQVRAVWGLVSNYLLKRRSILDETTA